MPATRSRSSGPLGALLSSPTLDVRLPTALQVLQELTKKSLDAEQTRWLMRYGSRQRVRRAGAAARRGEDRGREEDSSEQDRSEPERTPEAAVKGEVES